MILLGVDPGVASTGIGIVKKEGSKLTHIYHTTIKTPAHTPISKRLLSIHQQLESIIHQYRPNEVAVESLFFSNNIKTAVAVSQARGVILLTAEKKNIPLAEYTPNQVKSGVCGYGSAIKKQVQYMVKQLLNLKETPKPDDAADALAIAICHAHTYKVRVLSTRIK